MIARFSRKALAMSIYDLNARISDLEQRVIELKAVLDDVRQRLGRTRPGSLGHHTLALQFDQFEADLDVIQAELSEALRERRQVRQDIRTRPTSPPGRPIWRPAPRRPSP